MEAAIHNRSIWPVLCCTLACVIKAYIHADQCFPLPTCLSLPRVAVCHQSDEDIMVDLVSCIERMEDLMEDLQKNRGCSPIHHARIQLAHSLLFYVLPLSRQAPTHHRRQ